MQRELKLLKVPVFSVVVPSYNHEKYISASIESVLNQTYSDFELIIIDDASEDRSPEIIKFYAEKDRRIRPFYHKNNKGISFTFNHGLNEAKGKYITFVASDDVLDRHKLEKELEILRKDENLVVFSEALIIDSRGNPTGKTFSQIKNAEKKKKCGYIFEELLKSNFILDVTLKRENLKGIEFDEHLKYLNDYQFVVDLSKKYKFHFISEPLSMYRLHGQNITLNDAENWRNDMVNFGLDILRKYRNDLARKIKARLMLYIASSYSQLGYKKRSRKYFYKALMLGVLDWRYLLFIANYVKNAIRLS